MLVPNAYFNMIAYIYANVEDATSGNIANGGATGFLLGVDSNVPEKPHIYIVTNAHVLEHLERMGSASCTIRINTQDDKTETIDTPLSDWFKHPAGHDIAIYLLSPDENWRYSYVLEEMLLKEEFVRTNIFDEEDTTKIAEIDIEDDGKQRTWRDIHKVGIGTDTVMVGRFMKHGGASINYPVVRRGHIAMLPFEPMKQKDRDHAQDGFLVETYSIGGFSGSPVFVQTAANKRNKAHDDSSNGTTYDQKVFLLGVDWGHFDFDGEVISIDNQTTLKVPSGMMCVLPAWQLAELINNPAVIEAREKQYTE